MTENSCYKCQTPTILKANAKVDFRATCTKCLADLHVCRNCQFYDRGTYNECREPQAERTVDKEKANRCEYFKFGKGSGSKNETNTKNKLDDLFK